MRIEESEPSSSSAVEMPPASAALLRKIVETSTDEEFIAAINKGREVHAVMGKTELHRWTEVLNRCDQILEKAVTKNEQLNMACDFNVELKNQCVSIIRFTVLLFECTSSRRIYKSVDRILSLLESTDMDLLAEVLRLLQVMGKRSKFLSTRIPQKDQHALAHRLTAIAQCWGGKLRAVKMAECLKREPKLPSLFPFTYTDAKQRTITVEQPNAKDTVGELITRAVAQLSPPVSSDSVPNQPFAKEDTYCLLSRLRMLVHFDSWQHRFKCLVVRLLSVSTLIYCRLGGTDENTVSSLLYGGFVEEIVDLLKTEKEANNDHDHSLYDAIQTEALSTLCSIVTYEKEPKIAQILEALSAGSYHGFLSVMTRQIVDELKNNNLGKPSHPSVSLATSLFSFIYHLASIEPGGDTLVGSGLTQTLLSVIGFHELPIDCITFGTRCARIIDLFTTIDVTAFKANNGMEICVNRVVHEIQECRKEQPFMIDVSHDMPFTDEPEPERNRRVDEDHVHDDDDEFEDDDEYGERERRVLEELIGREMLRNEGRIIGLRHHRPPVRRIPEPESDEPVIANPEDLIGTTEDPDPIVAAAIRAEVAAARAERAAAERLLNPDAEPEPAEQPADEPSTSEPVAPAEPAEPAAPAAPAAPEFKGGPWEPIQPTGLTCHQQRSGLIKGLLTFIKRAIGDVQFQDVMRHLMEGELPEALMHILSNAEYYSPSLFHQSAHLITNFVYQFPEELSSLQKRHVPYVIFQSLLRKELPNSKDVITTLGNVFTAMCLNERGLRQFKAYNPFKQIFRIVLSVKFLVTLRKKRSAETFESAQAIGSALDDLMRHYPDLKHDMMKEVILILDMLDNIGRNAPPGVELVPTLTKAMARSVIVSSSGSLLPREAHEAREEAPRAAAPEQADERVGDDAEEVEEPMEVEDAESDRDEEDNEMSMDEMSGEAPEVPKTPQPPASKVEYSDSMMCEDSSGKKILPIGDYMLLIARVVETMMTQTPSQRITEEFLQGNVMQKIMKLCHLPCITNETTHSTYVTTIANIIKHIVVGKSGFASTRNGPDAGPKLMTAIVGEFIKTINPLFEVNNGDFSALKAAESKKATILMHIDDKLVEKTLVELNSIVPILLNLNKQAPQVYAPQDTRNRVFETWKMPDGVKLYGMLRKLSRMLGWEHELVQTLKPTIRTAATQTEADMLSDEPSDTQLDNEELPPWDDEALEMEKKKQQEESKEARWKTAGVTQEEHDFWLKNKALQDIVSKSHHLVKELLNSMGKQINLPSVRRPRTREPAQLPLAATQCISMIFTSIYKDLKWEPPGAVNSPMAYGRYIELLTQLNYSLFETSNNGRCGNPALAQNFYTSGCHKAFFELFADKIIPYLGDDMPEGVEKTMEEWCRLAVKLTDRTSIVNQQEQTVPRRDRFNQDFDTNKYLKLVCRDMFNAYKQFFEKMAQMPDWELKSLKKVCENAFSVFKEVAKNLVEETELAAANAADAPPDEWAPGAPRPAAAAAAAAGGNNDVPAAAPAADPQEDQVVMLMDLGFSRDVVMYALENTRSADEAANYLLAHGHEIRVQEVMNALRDDGPMPLALVQQVMGGGAPAPPAPAAPNADEIEMQLNAILADYAGYELVQAAQRVLIDAGLDALSEQLAETIPNDGMEVRPSRVIEETMEMVRNPRSTYEENIATPLIPPLSQLKIDQDVSLNSACKQLFPLVNRLLLVSNDTIHPCAELITSIFPAMTVEWRKEHLIAKIIGDDLLEMAKKLVGQEVDEKGVPKKHEIARTMANRLHFAVLIFDKVSEEYVEWIGTKGMTEAMLTALEYLVNNMKNVEYYQSLITRVICWFDLFAKVDKLINRRKFLQSLTPTLEWSWQQVEEDGLRRRADFHHNPEKKWTAYDPAAQKTLNEAFFSGERWAKVLVKRGGRPAKKFDVDLISMKQHEGTLHEVIRADLPANVEIKMEDLMASEAKLPWCVDDNDRLLKLSADVLEVGVLDPNCSYSVLGFVARITSHSRNAVKFLELGGIESTLKLKARCAASFPFLVSMIVRNCIDDDMLTQAVFDKTFRSYVSTPLPVTLSDYAPNKMKDFAASLHMFGSLSNRNPLAFTEAVNKFARIQGSDMLPIAKEKKPTPSTSGTPAAGSSSSSSQQPTSSAAAAAAASASSTTVIENNWRAVKVVNMVLEEVLNGNFAPAAAQARMLSQEKLLQLLAEIVKSYPSLAIVVAEKQHNDKSAIHCLIDNFICLTGEKQEIANALKTLIAVTSAAQHATRAQELIVIDVKNVLAVYSDKALELRKEGVVVQQENELEPDEREAALAAFEKDEKEVLQKISEICAIIMTMCQNCPTSHNHHHHHHIERMRHHLAPQQNTVMKLFHKKKICGDLIKTIHCLQLNTKDSLDSVNQILKTLDILLEGSGSPTFGSTHGGPRTIFEMMAGRSRDRREVAGGPGNVIEREFDAFFNSGQELGFDGEMRQLLRRLNDETLRPGRNTRALGALAQAAAEEEGEASDTSEQERSDSPSEASQNEAEDQAVEGEVRDDAVEANVEVNEGEAEQVIENPAGAIDEVGEVVEVPERMEEDLVEEDADDEEDEDADADREQPDDDDGQEQDDDDEEDDDEEDDDDDPDIIQVVDPNPEPSGVRRLLVEEDDDDDDDGDEDGDSMEEDVARLELDDDYFDIGGGPFAAEMHRMDEMLFQPTGVAARGLAFAEMFREDFEYFYPRPSYRMERRATPRNALGVISEHPLLTRPSNDNDLPRRQAINNYRAEILSMSGTRTSLQRQNAIRRANAHDARELEAVSRGMRMPEMPSARVLMRSGEGASSFFDHIFEMRPSNVALNSRVAAYRNYTSGDREERRDVKATQVPGLLDRLDTYMSSMDPVSSRFVISIVNSYLTTLHKDREIELKREAEAKAKAKREADAKKAEEEKKKGPQAAETQTQSDLGLATPAATNTTNTVSEAVAPNASRGEGGEETATTPASGAPEAAPAASEEPMETGDDEQPLPQSSAATAASSVAGAEEMEEVERQVAEEALERERRQLMGGAAFVEEEEAQLQQDIPDAEVPAEQGQEQVQVQEQEQPPAEAPAREEMPEEFRAILGDIEIPDGVDPAFLAALPEDMRAEVIRDFQRQRRAERASRPVAAPAAPAAQGAQGAEEAQEPAPNAPLVEPIDPVFLNALPPELQEEVIAEHERRVREAEENLRRANEPPVVNEMDGAAVIASLPLNERAQVLAEMDETELAGLPAEMQNEARRARAAHVDTGMARYGRFMFRNPPGAMAVGARGTAAGRTAARPGPIGPTVGAQAGNAIQAPTDHPHILDKESIMTLCLLYLVDRVPHTRLQKVLRSACVNQTTCDFIVWCLLALLDKASEANTDDEEIVSNVPAWLDSIAVSGVGHNERVLRISENAQKVSIHSMLAVPICKNILDLLASIARSYPGNFLPAILRQNAKPTDNWKQVPSFQQFWNMVQNSSKYPKTKDWSAPPEQQLEECPLGQMLNSLQKPTMAMSPLKEKVLKVASQIMVTLPMDTLKLMGVKPDEQKKPLSKKLEHVIRVMTTGSCSSDGLADGLTILSEAMRTFDETTSVDIYEHLFTAVTKLGGELLPQIDHLIEELDEAQSQKPEDGSPQSDQPSTSKTSQLVVDISAGGRTATGRFDGERLVIDGDQNMRLQMSSCKELQLPAVTVLTDKSGAQYALLSALQTLVKVRNHMKTIRKDKARRASEAKKKEKTKESETAPSATPTTEPSAEASAPTTSTAAPATPSKTVDEETEPRISERLSGLESLWNSLSECLFRLGKASDPHAVLALQPAAEAFFLVHASQQQKLKKDAAEAVAKRKESQAGASTSAAAVASSVSHDGLREDLDADTAKLIDFAEKHRQVLNQALRQNNAVLSAGGPFAILTQFPKLLDFDVKRKFFRKELTKLEPSIPRYRRNDVSVQVTRNRVFSDSFRELFRLRPSEWKNRFYIIFQGEEGQDAGGLLREWFSVITREIFNPDYALFTTAPGDMVTYMINKASYINPEHLDYFKFVGRLIAKSVFEHKYLDCYFTRAFYKHILNLPVKPQDLESEDPAYFNSLEFLLNNQIDGLDLDMTFSTEIEEFGVRSVRDLKPNGRKIEVTDANKEEYVKLVCQMKMTGSIRKQLDAFLTGFYEIIPKDLISMFNEQELELLISGLPTVDIDDMAANTDYKGFLKTSTHIQWFWRALRSFEKEDKAKFLQFVTGTSKVPLQGFAALEGMNGVQKFSIHCDSRGGDRLPAAHTCFNQLDLPQYESYEKLRSSLLLAIRECTEGFGFA